MKRDYVIVANQYCPNYCLMFWGHYTEDDAERRSFGGYTRDLDACEKYTKEELENSGYHFKFYRKNMKWRKHEHFYIKIADLEKLGRKMTIIYR